MTCGRIAFLERSFEEPKFAGEPRTTSPNGFGREGDATPGDYHRAAGSSTFACGRLVVFQARFAAYKGALSTSEIGAKSKESTFVPEPNEPGGLSTAARVRGIMAVDSGSLKAPRVSAPPSPPCPRAAGTPTGRSPFSTEFRSPLVNNLLHRRILLDFARAWTYMEAQCGLCGLGGLGACSVGRMGMLRGTPLE